MMTTRDAPVAPLTFPVEKMKFSVSLTVTGWPLVSTSMRFVR
jgi:hypothetical protein